MIQVNSESKALSRVDLKQVLLVYSSEGGAEESFVTVHDPIIGRGGKVCVGAGRALTPVEWAKIVSQTKISSSIPLSLFDSRVLYFSGELMVWYEEPSVKTLYFTGDFARYNGIKAAVPGMIYAARRKEMSVWVYKGSKRPSANTPLFQAPYFNVYESGDVCGGSTPYPNDMDISSIDLWEKAFWMSAFSHPNTTKLVNGSYRKFLSACSHKKAFAAWKFIRRTNEVLGEAFKRVLK